MDVASGNVECIRRSDKGYEAMDILSHENHALYLKSINMLQSKYQCPKREMVFVSGERLKNYKKNQCELVNIKSFPAEPTIYKPAPNAIRSLLTKYSIKDANQYIDHFIVYDFEAILKPTATQHGENTVFTNEHIPVSVSVADSLTEEVRCFVNDDPKMLLMNMFKYIGDVSVKIQQYNVDKYKSLLQKIINAHGLTGMEIPGFNLGKKYKMSDVESWIKEGKYGSFFHFHSSLGFGKQRSDYGRLKQLIDQVPVFGFNSGRYDINLIQSDLFAIIGTDNIKSAIKNPSYMRIATSKMKLLDISNYVPAGTSYDNYLTTYLGGCKCDDKIRCVCGLGKGRFPYITKYSGKCIGRKVVFQTSLNLYLEQYSFVNLIIMELVKPITSDHDLIILVKRIGVHLDDIFESSEITHPLPKKGSYLILLRQPNMDVGHWTGVHNGEYFDLMGEAAPTKYGIGRYNPKQIQGTYGDYCGPFCILWLYAKQHNQPNLFTNMTDLNLTILS
ncbi:unnamed protein product [Phytophthora lilii]|uniref:Unnamed protein product n=1 Tax=Phytophthora lilii TaxID=2077276 RepID=A0A9W6UD45_9STRA|nr:unnamed protein product [Phytophthora lilii]